MTLLPIERVSIVMAASLGTLDTFGRPVDWQIEETIREEWGTLRLYVGGVDVTELRGAPSRIVSYTLTAPFGYGPAVIAFPQISPYDTLGDGDLDWLVHGANVDIIRVHPDGETETPLWEGLSAVWVPVEGEDGYDFGIQCIGALFQASLEPMPPRFERDRIDIGLAISDALNTVPGRRYDAIPNVVTTIGTRNRGGWESRLDYVQTILSTAWNSDGTLQWTVGCDPGREPTLTVKDRVTQQWTVSVGQPGARLENETSDVTATGNVFFGEGVAEDGGRWRNSRYPEGGDPLFRPLIWVSQNEPYLYDSEGNVTGANPSYDPDRLRVARYENYGAGVSKADGFLSAQGELERDVNPGWIADLVLTADPEEGSRYEIRAGHNIGLRHHHGHPVRLFHVVKVDATPEQGVVRLVIDTNARDAVTIAGIRARDKEAATDPARRLNPPRRRSRQTPDEKPVFDAEDGAGIVPATALIAGWNVIRIPASAYGQIVRTELTTTSSARAFAVGVFSKAVTTSTLNTLVGNPLDGANETPWDNEADDLSTAGLLMAWGDAAEPAGYYPRRASEESLPPITGRMVDDLTWDFISDTQPWLWLAIYPSGTCTVEGRLYVAPEAG